MGMLIYGARVSELEIEDRTLAHLQFVVATKLRRNEQFMLTWNHGVERGSGRSAIWISPYIPVHFKFNGGRAPKLNRAWLEAMLDGANSPAGLHPTPEPSAGAAE
jgi:hypothetical protein